MSNYVKSTDFSIKDSLTLGDPNKIIKGTEINTEFNAIQTAVATKADLASPSFLGNPTATTQPVGNDSARLATTAFVQNQIATTQANANITGGTIDGVAITGGTVTGLATDLAVADGGTGKSTLAVNNVLLGNGTSAIQEVAPSTSGNILTSNGTTWQSQPRPQGVGEGQTWQNVIGGRVRNTDYTNSTDKPITVCITVAYNASNNPTSFVVGGVTIANTNGNSVGGFTRFPFTFIVPPTQTYRVNTNNTIDSWAELR